MEINFRGIKLGKIIITSANQINESIKISLDAQEVWDLFILALREKKIVFDNKEEELKKEVEE